MDEIEALVMRMVINTIAGKTEKNKELYEEYLRKRHLYVPVWEILEAKRGVHYEVYQTPKE